MASRDWVIGIRGPDDALKFLSSVLPNGPIAIRQEGKQYYLRADEFATTEDDGDIMNQAMGVLDQAAALLNFYVALPVKFYLSCAYWIDSSGNRHGALAFAYGTARTITPENLPLLAATDTQTGRTLASRLLSRLEDDDTLQKLFAAVSASDPTWADIYVWLELMGGERYLEKHRFASSSEIKRLRQTANYYRHGVGARLPARPFTINEARRMARGFVIRWLGERATGPTGRDA